MSNNKPSFKAQLLAAVLKEDGATGPAWRRAIQAAAAGDHRPEPEETLSPVLQRYLEKVSRHAYRVTDSEVAALRAQGYAQDALFEFTVCAAVGAGLRRLERGLALLAAAPAIRQEASHETR